MKYPTSISIGLIWVLLAFGLVGWGSYTIGYDRGKDEWNRQIQKVGEDLMRKIAGPNATINWERMRAGPVVQDTWGE